MYVIIFQVVKEVFKIEHNNWKLKIMKCKLLLCFNTKCLLINNA